MAPHPSAGLLAVAGDATRQHGLFTAAQATAAGITKGLLDRRVRTGELVAVDHGVYRSVTTPVTWHQRLMAACLVGPAVVSHRSAAELADIPIDARGLLEVTALRHRRRSPDDVIWHESYLLDERSTTVIAGLPVTHPARTVIDLASVVTGDELQRALDDVLRRRLASVASLTRLLDRMGPRRIGSSTLRSVLDARAASAVPESDLETQFELLLRAHHRPMPVAQFGVTAPDGRSLRLDFAYPERRVGIELLGARYHARPDRWARDIERLSLLASLGWHVLTFGYDQVVHRPSVVLAALDHALNR